MYTNEDFFKILGKISVFTATTDVLITEMLFALVSKEKFVELDPLDDNSTLTQKLYWIKKLEKENVKDEELLRKVHLFIDEAIRIFKERNRYVHDHWIFKPEYIAQGKIQRSRLLLKDDSIKFEEPKDFDLNDLYLFCNEIGEIQKKVAEVSRISCE
jgi:hypothetical protein